MSSTNQSTKSATAAATKTKATKKQEVEEPVEELVEEVEEVEGEEGEGEEVEEVEEDASGDKKKKKYEYVCESVEAGFSELKRIDAEVKELLKYREAVMKSTEKFAHKQLKQTKKRRSNENATTREANGFVKPRSIPQKFKDFYETHLKGCEGFSEVFATFDSSVDVPRTDVTKMIYHYIRSKNLYTRKEDGTLDKRSIKPDEVLKSLFDIKKGDIIYDHVITEQDLKEEKREDPKVREKIGQKTGMTFNNFQTYMNRLYASDEEVETAVEEEAVEAEAEAVEELPKVSKGKKTSAVASK